MISLHVCNLLFHLYKIALVYYMILNLYVINKLSMHLLP